MNKNTAKILFVASVSSLPTLFFLAFVALRFFDVINLPWFMVIFIPFVFTGAFFVFILISILTYGLIRDFFNVI